MYVITGATGHTGKVAAETLLASGAKVRVIGRDAQRLQRLSREGRGGGGRRHGRRCGPSKKHFPAPARCMP